MLMTCASSYYPTKYITQNSLTADFDVQYIRTQLHNTASNFKTSRQNIFHELDIISSRYWESKQLACNI